MRHLVKSRLNTSDVDVVVPLRAMVDVRARVAPLVREYVAMRAVPAVRPDCVVLRVVARGRGIVWRAVCVVVVVLIVRGWIFVVLRADTPFVSGICARVATLPLRWSESDVVVRSRMAVPDVPMFVARETVLVVVDFAELFVFARVADVLVTVP